MMYKAVIFDRDGTLNANSSTKYITRVADFQLYREVPKILRFLEKHKIKIGIVTNQQGIALGEVTIPEVLKMHRIIEECLADKNTQIPLLICPHRRGSCECRKPKPRNLTRMALMLQTPIDRCLFVGDSPSDYLAALELNMDFLMVRREAKRVESSMHFVKPPKEIETLASLPEVINV